MAVSVEVEDWSHTSKPDLAYIAGCDRHEIDTVQGFKEKLSMDVVFSCSALGDRKDDHCSNVRAHLHLFCLR